MCPVKLYFTIWRALSRNGKPKNVHNFICRISYERVTILEFFKNNTPRLFGSQFSSLLHLYEDNIPGSYKYKRKYV